MDPVHVGDRIVVGASCIDMVPGCCLFGGFLTNLLCTRVLKEMDKAG